jgi:hypothetical protein
MPTVWDRIRELFWKVMAGALVAMVVSSPAWLWASVTYGYNTIKAIETNGKTAEKAETDLQDHLAATLVAEEGRERQYEQIQKQLGDLNMLYGLATISAAGDKVTASINVAGPAARLRQGMELWVTNNTDPDRTKIKVVVAGTFTAGSHYLLRLSREAGKAIEASKNEIQVQVDPIEQSEEATSG